MSLKQSCDGRYRLDYRRTFDVPLITADEWRGGPWMVVRGSIEQRYGYQPVELEPHMVLEFIARVQRMLKRRDPEPATLGPPFRRPSVRRSLDSTAWLRRIAGSSWHVDADLIALAERATGLSDWSLIKAKGPRFPYLLLGTYPEAVVAPLWPIEIEGPIE